MRVRHRWADPISAIPYMVQGGFPRRRFAVDGWSFVDLTVRMDTTGDPVDPRQFAGRPTLHGHRWPGRRGGE
ncbi:hypothetical protein [Streptomyces sp. DH37]|uniref:hypothetical protein n=1 Tax=Streptomyces sp. DH37 TaxID=3040122 RepID=UPI0024416265|nr:hypothetical protein [Streptomyces sp. DH37]MDG9706199.1 hypothetical protein [Streptomyces sp. DH37]